jgi:hypothetical protein
MKQTAEQFEHGIFAFAWKSALLLTLLAGLFLAGTLARAQQPTREQCPNGYHYVQPPCYYDASGYRVCPNGYWVCNP